MIAPANLLELFVKDLENLKDNDKYKINALTIVARDHKDGAGIAQGIVELTVRHVLAIPSELKLLGLYVIDSIVKNVGAPYRKLYTPHVVDTFVHSFQEIRDEKGRLKLYNLRTTWKDIFPNAHMYELDVRVREHDPAWPLLATSPENKPAFRSLPNIPKIQSKTDSSSPSLKAESEASNNSGSQVKTFISESRDPRLNRKRKSSPQSASNNQDEFLIDRSGDRKMESVARKQGKRDEMGNTKKVTLFGGEDLDMRSQITPAIHPAKSSAWSSYVGKHSEVCSRREPKDVDMRFTPSASSNINPSTVESHKKSRNVLSVSVSKSHNDFIFTPHCRSDTNFSSSVPDGRDVNIHSIDMKVVPTPAPAQYSDKRFDFDHEYDDKFLPEFSRERRILPSQHYLKANAPLQRRGPPIRGPIWSVEINGLPDMINIGVDPRMLCLVNHPKPPRRITVDGHQYPLLLDRVQPLILIGDRIHAVRFRCEVATVVIDGRCFEIPGTGFTKVVVGNRCFTAYLGGPGHELVIDGRPHTVPLNAHLTYVNVGYHSVGVKFVGNLPRNINVLPPIPPRLLKWAGQGLFGSPRHLNLAPLNPLQELAHLAEIERGSRSKPSCMRDNDDNSSAMANAPPPKHQSVEKSASPTVNGTSPVTNRHVSSANDGPPQQSKLVTADLKTEQTAPGLSLAPESKSLNVHELFQKLVEAGIVPGAETPKPTEPPELSNYSWERFKIPSESDLDALYKGHQCGQCGVRFESELSPEFAKHLDYHYMKNSNNSQDRRYSRNFYQSLQYWLISEMTHHDGGCDFEPQSPIRNLQEYRCPSFADPSKNVCAVCFENFEVVWDHDEEEWMLQDAIRIDDKVYHPVCQEDAGKELALKKDEKDTSQSATNSTMCKVEEPYSSEHVNNNNINSNPSSDVETNFNPADEDTFTCDDHAESDNEQEAFNLNKVTIIPGLSPIANSFETESDDVTTKPLRAPNSNLCLSDNDSAADVEHDERPALISVKSEAESDSVTMHSAMTADPLAALKAVLKGDLSLLNFPSNSAS